MKKAYLFIVLIICSLVFLWPPYTARASGITRGEITGSNVALRKEANLESAVICRLSKGAVVEILQTNVNAEWDKVKYNDKIGYVNRLYVSFDSSLSEYKLDYFGTVINCKQFINVRSTPSTKVKSLGTVNKGAKLKVTQKDCVKGWHQVEFEGKTAYVSAEYLEVIPVVEDTQLTDLTIKGGTLSPLFSPNEYGYVVSADASKVTIKVKANSGVGIDINDTGKSSITISMPSGTMKTVRIKLNGKIRYSIYISRDVLTFGTWNIKRGNDNLLMQGRLVNNQCPDIMALQEVFQNRSSDNIIDNLASLKTTDMPYTYFGKTIEFPDGSSYGIGILSRYKLSKIQTYTLDSEGLEKRILMKAVVNINGKSVSIYSTHFSYNSASIRAKQFSQVVRIMNDDKNKYKVLFGDFNAAEAEFAPFKDYTIVHNDQTVYYDYSMNMIKNNMIDNIIVTKNIKVVNSRIIKTSLSDHDPLFAYLVLK